MDDSLLGEEQGSASRTSSVTSGWSPNAHRAGSSQPFPASRRQVALLGWSFIASSLADRPPASAPRDDPSKGPSRNDSSCGPRCPLEQRRYGHQPVPLIPQLRHGCSERSECRGPISAVRSTVVEHDDGAWARPRQDRVADPIRIGLAPVLWIDRPAHCLHSQAAGDRRSLEDAHSIRRPH